VKRFREAFRLFRPVLRKKTFRRHRDWIEDLNDALGGGARSRRGLDRAAQAHPPASRSRPGSVGGLLARLEAERIGAAGALGPGLAPAMESRASPPSNPRRDIAEHVVEPRRAAVEPPDLLPSMREKG